MIGRGRYKDIYLYEVTEQDLLLDDGVKAHYHSGNVLMFVDKRMVDLGNEIARAEDLTAAQEYLDQRETVDNQAAESYSTELSTLTSLVQQRDESLRSLTEKIEQRDELLRDLAESLQSQRQDNELLHLQLEQVRKQLAAEEIKQNELVDDLQQVSSETHTIETTLERVMDEKFRLEQELAERITELVELNLQNDDLKKQLVEPDAPLGARADALPDTRTDAPSDAETLDQNSETQVVTMSSGKKIHILHEFPTAPKQTLAMKTTQATVSALRAVAIILSAVLVLGTASVITTAQVNGISYGAALDLVMRSLTLGVALPF